MRPSGLRELHRHSNSDEWLYFIRGRGRITLFVNGGKAHTADFAAGDVGYLPRTLGHNLDGSRSILRSGGYTGSIPGRGDRKSLPCSIRH